MKKPLYMLMAAGLFTFASCDSATENNAEEATEEVGEDIEEGAVDAAEGVEDGAEEVEDAVEN